MSASQHPAVAAADVDRWAPGRAVADSRARAQSVKHPVLATASERVDYIIDLMGRDVFNRHTSRMLRRTLSAIWGVEESTILNYTSEAHRAIARELDEDKAPVAARALARLEQQGSTNPYCDIPGVASAAVRANEILLKATGYGEPEEDKSRLTTLIQVGQVVASPVFSGLLNGTAKQLNGKNQNDHGSADSAAEVAEVVSGCAGHGPVDGDPRKRD